MKRIAIALACSLALVACTDGAKPAPTLVSDPTPASPPARSALPEPAGQPSVRSIEPGEGIDFPDSAPLIVVTGCWQCDGPPNSIIRLRKRDDGSIGERYLRGSPISGYAVSHDGSRIAVSRCVGPNCGVLGVPPGPVDTEIVVSEDGGATFSDPVVLEGAHSLVGFTFDQLVIRGPYTQLEEDTPAFLFPSMQPLPGPNPDAGSPLPLPSEVLWASLDRRTLFGSDGAVLAKFEGVITQVVPLTADGSRLAIVTYPEVTMRTPRYRLDIVVRTPGGLVIEESVENRLGILEVGGALGDGRLVVNLTLPVDLVPTSDGAAERIVNFLPAILDLNDAVAHPLTDPFLREPYLGGRNLIIAVLQGP